MKTKKALTAAAIILFFLLATSLIVIVFLLKGTPPASRNFQILLSAADQELAEGFLPGVEEKLRAALPLAQSSEQYGRVLKRIHRLAEYREDYEFLAQAAATAWQKFPRDEELIFLAAYTALKQAKINPALTILADGGKTPGLNRLRLAALLRSGKAIPAELEPDYKYAMALKLLDSRDPALFQSIGGYLDNKRIYLDAALLFMENGDPLAAKIIVNEHLAEPAFDQAAVFIALDNLEIDQALGRLSRLLEKYPAEADYYALAGDLYLRKKNFTEAKFNYLKTINYLPDSQNTPALYLNLNWLYQAEQEFDSARLFLDDGLALFPQNSELLFEKAKLLLRQTRYEEARQMIEVFPGQLSGNLRLLLLYLSRKSMEPERYYLKLWEVFNENKDDALVCRTLTRAMLETENTREASRALDIYTAASGVKRDGWLLHYRGLLAAAAGNYQSALELLDESNKLRPEAVVRYNKGVVLMAAGKYEEANTVFWQLLKLDEDSLKKNRIFYSQVMMRSGETMAARGDSRGALKQLRFAAEIDPENYHAILLLKQLERSEEK